jgi:hypothetical protein
MFLEQHWPDLFILCYICFQDIFTKSERMFDVFFLHTGRYPFYHNVAKSSLTSFYIIGQHQTYSKQRNIAPSADVVPCHAVGMSEPRYTQCWDYIVKLQVQLDFIIGTLNVVMSNCIYLIFQCYFGFIFRLAKIKTTLRYLFNATIQVHYSFLCLCLTRIHWSYLNLAGIKDCNTKLYLTNGHCVLLESLHRLI